MGRSEWVVPVPAGLSGFEAAQIGTAGYTAMLCVDSVQRCGVSPSSGPVLVSGTPGGVGSVATVLLSQLGYHVVAVSGPGGEHADYLKSLGAAELLDRDTLQGDPKPLGKEMFAGCVDSAGGQVLANILPLIKHSGAVAACGLAGVDSVFMPVQRRLDVYNKFGPLLGGGKLDMLAGSDKLTGLGGVLDLAKEMLRGNIQGRYVVDVNK